MSKRNLKLTLNLPSQTTALEPQQDALGDFVEFGELSTNDFDALCELGAGNSGTVVKVLHRPSNVVMARKIIPIEAKPAIRKNIATELQTLKKCQSEYIVTCYGAYMDEGEVNICMEFMDVGSLDRIYHKTGAIPEAVLSHITMSVLRGLVYLYDTHRIIHRDVKPQNILVNGKGQVKICDFGVSGELVNSIANSFVGTSAYMAPERINGDIYRVQSDVWSLGVSLLELAMGHFPFPTDADGNPMSVFELLNYIVTENLPKLPDDHFSKEMCDFVNRCLIKEPQRRPSPKELLRHPLIFMAMGNPVDLRGWAQHVLQKMQ